MSCTQAELAVLFEALEERIERECAGRIPVECMKLIRRVVNDLREHGKEYIRSKYGL
ncbi:MAG: hypothetical protein LRS46_03110 [Desulfurococcales archaeon]|nr:hypothetical protein [Desulfurococcales archaeon]